MANWTQAAGLTPEQELNRLRYEVNGITGYKAERDLMEALARPIIQMWLAGKVEELLDYLDTHCTELQVAFDPESLDL